MACVEKVIRNIDKDDMVAIHGHFWIVVSRESELSSVRLLSAK